MSEKKPPIFLTKLPNATSYMYGHTNSLHMIKSVHIFLVAFAALVALTACHKSDYQAVSTNNGLNTGNNNSLTTLLASLRTLPQTLQVTAGAVHTISGKSGTRIYFYPNSFRDANGTTIQKGTIDLQLTEIYTAGVQAQNATLTLSEGKLLCSGGQVCIKASMNGEEVFADRYGIGFSAKTSYAQPMNLFYPSASSDNFITWVPASIHNGTVIDGPILDSFSVLAVDSGGAVYPTTFHTYYNRFDSCTHFNWINCGWFLQASGATTNISITLTDPQFNNSNTVALLLLPDTKSVVNLSTYSSITTSFSLARGFEVPVGLKADVVILALVAGNYYAYLGTDITINNGMTINPILTKTTLDHLQTTLSTL